MRRALHVEDLELDGAPSGSARRCPSWRRATRGRRGCQRHHLNAQSPPFGAAPTHTSWTLSSSRRYRTRHPSAMPGGLRRFDALTAGAPERRTTVGADSRLRGDPPGGFVRALLSMQRHRVVEPRGAAAWRSRLTPPSIRSHRTDAALRRRASSPRARGQCSDRGHRQVGVGVSGRLADEIACVAFCMLGADFDGPDADAVGTRYRLRHGFTPVVHGLHGRSGEFGVQPTNPLLEQGELLIDLRLRDSQCLERRFVDLEDLLRGGVTLRYEIFHGLVDLRLRLCGHLGRFDPQLVQLPFDRLASSYRSSSLYAALAFAGAFCARPRGLSASACALFTSSSASAFAWAPASVAFCSSSSIFFRCSGGELLPDLFDPARCARRPSSASRRTSLARSRGPQAQASCRAD